METLIDRVWGDAAPTRARHAVHVYVTRIRKVIDPVAGPGAGDHEGLVHRAGGYVLDLPADRVDLIRFRDLMARAARPITAQPTTAQTTTAQPATAQPATAQPGVLLRQALDLWRGVPLAGLSGEWAARSREAWARQRVDAVLSWAEAELAHGNARAVVNELTDLAAEHPLDEPVMVALMRALYTAGRGAEAVDHYGGLRRRFAEELGVDPGQELQRLHRVILRGARTEQLRVRAVAAPSGSGIVCRATSTNREAGAA